MPASIYPTGTTIYDPRKAWNGFTLYAAGPTTVLVDMNGSIAKSWEGVAGAPVKMLPGGHLMGSGGRQVGAKYLPWDNSDLIQVDPDGNIVWEFDQYEQVELPGAERAGSARWHHDFQREGNPVGYYVPGTDSRIDGGNTLICCHKIVSKPSISDRPLADSVIIEVDWEGKVIWEWLCSDHFEEIAFSEEAKETIARNPNLIGSRFGSNYSPNLGDWVHMNSISYLGPNKWYDSGDERFHPDNIIWDGRQLCHIAITDKKTGKLVWQVGPDFNATDALRKLGWIIGQHQAHMIPRGLPGEGNILVYDNGGRAGYGPPNPGAPTGVGYAIRDHTRVLEFDPTTLEIVWQYTPLEAGYAVPETAAMFYSYSISGMQRLPNGNTLITEGQAGRLVEVTPEHETAWEYLTPLAGSSRITSNIYRAYRVPYDWVAEVDRPKEKAIERIDIREFRVPGSPQKKAGKVIRVKTAGGS